MAANAPEGLKATKTRLTIKEARERAKTPGLAILWRPEPNLPEERQYCLLLHGKK